MSDLHLSKHDVTLTEVKEFLLFSIAYFASIFCPVQNGGENCISRSEIVWKEYVNINPLGQEMEIPRIQASKTGALRPTFWRKVVRTTHRRETTPGRW